MEAAVTKEGAWHLRGSVNAENRDNAAYLNRNDGKVKLNWNDDDANPNYGSASRRDCLSRKRPKTGRLS